MKKGKEEREVTHYEFSGWPNFSVPTNSSELEAFESLVREVLPFVCDSKEEGQLLIHCRKGHGRSGTFLTILSQLYMLQNKSSTNLSIRDTLKYLRSQRTRLVETDE